MRELKSYEKCLQDACDYAGITLNEQMLDMFEIYYTELIDWNEQINLTAITDKQDVYLKHFADSIYGTKFMPQNCSLCDIGTGAGFPAVVVKIVRPDIVITLVDALEKRIKFLNELITKLGLINITALHLRAEDVKFKQSYLNRFDIVTARAVAKMNTLTEYCLPFVKPNGKFVAYKSNKIEQEVLDCKKAVQVLGGGNIDLKEYQLDAETSRLIVVVDKIKGTDNKYPRDKNRPKLKPIMWLQSWHIEKNEF